MTTFGTLEQFMTEFAPAMSARTEAALTPLFDPAKEQLSPEVAELFARPGRFWAPKPVQAAAVEACWRDLKVKRHVHMAGEMGVGKTPMGAWLIRLLAGQSKLLAHRKRTRTHTYIRAVITCPNHLVHKWQDHCERIMPGCRARIVNSFRDLIPLVGNRPPTCNEIWIIPRDKGKLSYAWRPGPNVRTRPLHLKDGTTIQLDRFACPRCGKVIEAEVKGTVMPVGLAYFCNSEGKPGSRRVCDTPILDAMGNARMDRRGEAMTCGEPLWQAFNGTPHRFSKIVPSPGQAPRRISPAEFIWRQGIRFDVYVADEIQELQNASLQGGMFGILAKRSRKVILATGTVTGGYATNLYHTLWRTDAGRMRADGLSFDDAGEINFVKSYGVLQTIKKYTAKDSYQNVQDLVLGRGQCKSSRVKTLPGISPQLYSRMLMPCSVFVSLKEMSGDLPPFDEYVHAIPLPLETAVALADMTDKFLEHAAAMKSRQLPCRAWSAARAAFLRWPDRPWPSYDIYDRDAGGGKIHALHVPELAQDVEYPKERRLRRLIQAELMRGRKCAVYTEMTGEAWDVTVRLQRYLERHGIKAIVLRTQQQGGPKPEDRDDWIKARMPAADVLICNPNLVKTGLDLYSTPTIIWFYTGYSLYTLRQASRRAWRLGQKDPCKVYYLCYGSVAAEAREKCKYVCLQSAAMSLMASKMAASLALEGDFSAEGLAAMSDSEDVSSKLAKIIAGQISAEDPAVAFEKYRRQLDKIIPPPIVTANVVPLEPSNAAPIIPAIIPTMDRIPEPPKAPAPTIQRPAIAAISAKAPESLGENRPKNGGGLFGDWKPGPQKPMGIPARPGKPSGRPDIKAAMSRLSRLLTALEDEETEEALAAMKGKS